MSCIDETVQPIVLSVADVMQGLDMHHLEQPSMTYQTGDCGPQDSQPLSGISKRHHTEACCTGDVLTAVGADMRCVECEADGGAKVLRHVPVMSADVQSPGMDMTLWEAWYCHDGVTVFFGTSQENEDVIMVSLIVHAPPSLVTEVLAPSTSLNGLFPVR